MNIERLIENAKGDVDRELLAGTGKGGFLSSGYFSDGPLVDHCREEEQIDYAVHNLTKGVTVKTNGQTTKYTPDSNLRSALLVTDKRLLYVIGQADGDEPIAVQFSDVENVNFSTGVLKDWIAVDTGSTTYAMYVQKGSPIKEIKDYILKNAESYRNETRTESETRSPTEDSIKNRPEPDGGANPSSDSSTDGTKPDRCAHSSGNGEQSMGKTQSTSESGFSWSEPAKDPITDERVATESATGGTSELDGKDTHGEVPSNSGDSSSAQVANASATVEVLVSDENNNQVAGATVILSGPTFETSGKSKRTGRCCLTTPPTSEGIKMVVEHEDYGTVQDQVEVADGAILDVTISEIQDKTSTSTETSQFPDTSEESEMPTREQLLEEIADLDRRSSRKLTRGRMRADGKYQPEDYEAEFGTWSAGIKAASADEETPKTSKSRKKQEAYTKEEVLDAICEIAKVVNGRPTTAEMQEHGQMSVGPAYRFFNNWDDAVSAALDAAEGPQEAASGTTQGEAGTGHREPKTKPATEKSDSTTASAEISERPLSDGIDDISTGRLSAVVEIRDRRQEVFEKREVEFEVETSAGNVLDFVVWEKHGLDPDIQPGDRVRLDEVRLTRWETEDGPAHQLDSTGDLSISVVSKKASDTETVDQLVGVGGATENDAEVLVENGYTNVEDLKDASLEELRSIEDLDDGTALRIKADFG